MASRAGILIALGLALLTALTVFLALQLRLSATAEGQGLEVEVEQCDQYEAGQAPSGSSCDTQSRTVEQAPPPKPKPSPSPAPTSGDSAETHSYDLESGSHRVQNTDGSVEEESLELDLSPDGSSDPRVVHDAEEHAKEQAEAKKLLNADSGLVSVSTNGGSQFAGFGASMISGDEALSRFAVPPFLIPIYVAAGRAYNVPWNLLAAINQIETDFGRIRRQVSYAGALGWMQFMPGTWRAYGVDASGDGVADPFNPVDAIYGAARYLSASGAPGNLRRAVFAYNHADWYVDRVLKTASIYGSLPSGLVAETGSLAFGRFPVLGRVRYADDFRRAQAAHRRALGLWISGRSRAVAIATQNVKVKQLLLDRRLARAFLREGLSARGVARPSSAPSLLRAAAGVAGQGAKPVQASAIVKPHRGRGLPPGYGISAVPGLSVVVEDAVGNRYRYSGLSQLRPNVRPGARLRGGRPLGRLSAGRGARMMFSVRAAGGAAVDPRPLVDGYRLQEAARFYHAVAPLGGNPFVPGALEGTRGVSGSTRELAARVLGDSGIQIYPGGRDDIQRGVIDRRVMGALLYLRRNGLELTVTSLRSGHSFYTAGGSVSAHSFGAAVDIAAFNGQPVMGHQGPGSLTEQAVKLLMRLPGNARPAQLISLMNLGGPSFAMGDHADHLHVGYPFQASLGAGRTGDVLGRVDFKGGSSIADAVSRAKVSRRHEEHLSRRLSSIRNPQVSRRRGAGSLHVEAEAPNERREAEQLARKRRGPLMAEPTAAGARLIDVDIPARPGRGEAYAIGTVDGGGIAGWASNQTVLLRYVDGMWQIVGAPRNRAGRIVNPKLNALATVKGGRGYAVGDSGAVAELRGGRAPVMLPRAARTRLSAVDVRSSGSSLSGFAVGARGTAVKLTGSRAAREKVGSGRAALQAVALAGDGALASGAASGEGIVYRRNATGWAPTEVNLGLPEGLRVRLTSIDRSGGELWVSGGVSDARTVGTPAELPLAARLAGGSWKTFCAGTPALAAVAELGSRTKRDVCDAPLSGDPSDHGPAGDVAVTDRGVVVTTARGLQLYDYRSFRPILTTPSSYRRLALNRGGSGWALAADGRVARVFPTVATYSGGVERLPFARGGKLAAIAAPASGEQVLALGGGKGAVREDGKWKLTSGPAIGLRAAAFAGSGTAWATDETGALLRLRDGRWSGTGEDGLRSELRKLVADALGGEVLSTDPRLGRQSGVQALAFASEDKGYAVGGSGLVARFDGKQWRFEKTPAAASLVSIAAEGDRAVAAGRQGTLIERGKDGWSAPKEPRKLAGDRNFTAADALPDGTMLAVAGGMVLTRETEGPWRRALLQPLGVEVRRLAGYRTAKGELRALALAGTGDDLALLSGDARGWKPIELPAGMRVADFTLRRDSLRLWVIGHRDGQPVAARVALGVKPARAGDAALMQKLLGASGTASLGSSAVPHAG